MILEDTVKNKTMDKFTKRRMDTNIEICEILKAYAEKYPSMRFGQILWNLNILEHIDMDDSDDINFELADPHSDEPWEILERIKKSTNAD